MSTLSRESVVVGVDGGQSSTKAVVADLAGRPLGWSEGGPIWHVDEPGGLERVRAAITDAVGGALAHAGASAGQVSHAFLALTGSTDAGAAVARALLPHAVVATDSDALAALASGTYGRPGLALVAGTGSVAVAVDADGNQTFRGGWGPTLGDEGSAYWIGLRALRAIARADDGTGPATSLSAAVLGRLQVTHARDLFDRAYDGTLYRGAIAALAPFVIQCAVAGDGVAAGIRRDAVAALLTLVRATAAAANLPADARHVVLSGGLLLHVDELARPLAAAIRNDLPDFTADRPSVPPVVGAVALALRAAGEQSEHLLPALINSPIWPADLLPASALNRKVPTP